jgi:hypothetical protein
MLNCWCITWPIKFLGLFTCGRCCLLSIPPSIVVCWFLTWFTFRISDVYIQHISTVKEAKYKPKTTLYPWWFYHCLVLSILEFVVAFHLLKWGRQKRGHIFLKCYWTKSNRNESHQFTSWDIPLTKTGTNLKNSTVNATKGAFSQLVYQYLVTREQVLFLWIIFNIKTFIHAAKSFCLHKSITSE